MDVKVLLRSFEQRRYADRLSWNSNTTSWNETWPRLLKRYRDRKLLNAKPGLCGNLPVLLNARTSFVFVLAIMYLVISVAVVIVWHADSNHSHCLCVWTCDQVGLYLLISYSKCYDSWYEEDAKYTNTRLWLVLLRIYLHIRLRRCQTWKLSASGLFGE